MLSEHNPIAELIYQIQQKWIAEVSPFPELKLVRWLIKPEEARLYEGFLKLESTEHGAIPEVIVAMLSPFRNERTYATELVADWSSAFTEDHKTEKKLREKGRAPIWNPDTLLPEPGTENSNYYYRLLQMLSSFQQAMPDNSMRLAVALFPHNIADMGGFRRWLTRLLEEDIPDKVSFMIFDHIGAYYFDAVFKEFPSICKSLHINLNLDGAISKIAKIGDPNSPEVKLRECILEMGQAVQKKNEERLHEWGEKALQVTQRSGVKSMYASAHIIYAGMLFNFKQFHKIDSLLEQGLSIAKKGLPLEEAACRPLIIQHHGYMAASRQLQKRNSEAIYAYEKQGDAAIAYQLPGMALMPYRQAYTLSKKHLPERYDTLIQKAFAVGKDMLPEEKVNSGFAGVAFDYMQWHLARQQWEEAQQIDKEMEELSGADWKVYAKNPGKAHMTDIEQSTLLT